MAKDNYKVATFGAGCFWHPEEEFRQLKGVLETTVGYMGGTKEQPTYEDVCSTDSGHVEVTQVKFDPMVIRYKDLLDKFWEIHDPTQVNQQGADKGFQYRSVIFYHDDEQKFTAETKLRELGISGKFKDPIATKIESAGVYWLAENYHQKYMLKRKFEK